MHHYYKKCHKDIDYYYKLCYYVLATTETKLNKTASVRKEKAMDGMTNEQFKTVLEMVIQIIRDSKDKQEAIKKIEALLKK